MHGEFLIYTIHQKCSYKAHLIVSHPIRESLWALIVWISTEISQTKKPSGAGFDFGGHSFEGSAWNKKNGLNRPFFPGGFK